MIQLNKIQENQKNQPKLKFITPKTDFQKPELTQNNQELKKESVKEIQPDSPQKIQNQDTKIVEENQYQETPEEKIKFERNQRMFRIMFLFVFLHFFNFITVVNAFSDYQEFVQLDNKGDGIQFVQSFPKLKGSLIWLIVIDIVVFIAFFLFSYSTFQMKFDKFSLILYLFLIVYILKVVSIFYNLFSEPNMNSTNRGYIEQINNDVDGIYCIGDDQIRCKFIYTWNFFFFEIVFDIVFCSLASGFLISILRNEKLEFIRIDILKVEELNKKQQNEQSYDSKLEISQNQSKFEDSRKLIQQQNNQMLLQSSQVDQQDIVEEVTIKQVPGFNFKNKKKNM